MNFQTFQEAFLNQITQSDSETSEIDPLLRVLDHDKRMTPHERLDIYVRDYRGRLFDVLMEHYPETYNYLGEDDFLALFNAFIKTCPPSSYSLRYWGEQLPDFCEKTEPYNQTELIDLIRFEWTIHDLYDGEDVSILSSDSLSQIDPERWMDLCFQVIPCLKLSQAKTNVAVMWQSIKDNKPIESKTVDSYLVHWRNDYMVYFRELTQQEWHCLHNLSQGKTVGELCESLAEELSEEDAPQVFIQYLQSWINDGMLQKTSFN